MRTELANSGVGLVLLLQGNMFQVGWDGAGMRSGTAQCLRPLTSRTGMSLRQTSDNRKHGTRRSWTTRGLLQALDLNDSRYRRVTVMIDRLLHYMEDGQYI